MGKTGFEHRSAILASGWGSLRNWSRLFRKVSQCISILFPSELSNRNQVDPIRSLVPLKRNSLGTGSIVLRTFVNHFLPKLVLPQAFLFFIIFFNIDSQSTYRVENCNFLSLNLEENRFFPGQPVVESLAQMRPREQDKHNLFDEIDCG